jgi:Zn-finger in Ran binding protein and others
MTSIFDSIHFTSETIHPSASRRSSRSVTAAATVYDDSDSSLQRTIAFLYEPSDSEKEEEEEGFGHLMAYSTDQNASVLMEVGSTRIPNGSVAAITVTLRFVKDTGILLLLCADGSDILRFQVVWHPDRQRISFVEDSPFSPGPTAQSPTSCVGSALHPFHRVVALILQSNTSDSVLQLVALRPSDAGGDPTKLLTTLVLQGGRCSSISWSPNGEYLAISFNSDATVGKEEVEANVKLYRYNPLDATEEVLRIVATVPKQSNAEDEEETGDSWKCTFVHWLDALSLMIGYNTVSKGEVESPMASLHIWNLQETSLQVISSTDLGDVIPFFDVPEGQQHTFYASTLALGTLGNEQPMPMVFVAANVGNDVALIGKDVLSSAWSILEMEDSGLSTPVNEDDDFSFPTGIVLMSTGQLLLAGTDASISLYTPPNEFSLSLLPPPPMSENPSWNISLEASTSEPVSFADLATPNSVLDVSETSDEEPPEMLDEPKEELVKIPESDTGSALPVSLLSATLPPSPLSATPSLTNDGSLSLMPEQLTPPSVSLPTLNPLELPSSVDGSAEAVAVADPIVMPQDLATSIATMRENLAPDVVIESATMADEDASWKLPVPETEVSRSAAKAAKVFDEFDEENAGSLPSHRMEELLDALGEGFHGAELDDQVAIIDPDARGMLDRSAFIAWYVRLSSPQSRNENNDIDALLSIDSEEEAERAEERETARLAFEAISSDKGATIQVSDFPKLIESLNTTYCDENHGKVSRKLRKGDTIYIDDFLNWYVDWMFGGDESTNEDDEITEPPIETSTSGWGDVFAQKEGSWKCESCMVSNDADVQECAACSTPRPGTQDNDNVEPASAKVLAIGWGNTFSEKEGSWKCESCMVSNDGEKTECVACSTPRSGHSKPADSNTGLSASTLGSTIGSGGFFFGAAPAVAENPGVSTAQSTELLFSSPPVGAGGFTFGTQATGSSSIGTGGFLFGTQPVSMGSGAFGTSLDVPENDKVKTEEGNDKEDSIKAVDDLKTSFQFSALSFHQQSTPSTETTPVAAAPPVSMVAASPVKPVEKTAAAFPPMSLKGPTPIGLSSGTKAGQFANAPPMSMVAPSPIKPIEKTAAAFPPLSLKAPTPVGLSPSAEAAPVAATPPISMVAPSAVAFPPMSLKGPTPIGLSSSTKAGPFVTAPPISMVAPSPINPIEKTATAFPPMSLKGPTPIRLSSSTKAGPFATAPPISMVAPSRIKPIVKTAAAFPPMSLKAPTPIPSSSDSKTNLSSFSTRSAPVSMNTFPATTSFFSNKGSSVGFQSTAANSPITPPFPSGSTVGVVVPAESNTRGYSTADTKEAAKLTEYSQQYGIQVDQMHKSLHVIATNRPPVNAGDSLRRDIEHHVEALSAARADIVRLFGSLEEWKGMAACVLGRKTEATRNVSESQRLIGELLSPSHKTFDDFSTEPLDLQSETRRQKLSVRFIVTKRLLDIMKARLDLMSAMVTPQGGNALLASTLSSYNDVKAFDEAASKIERKVAEIASCHIPSPNTKVLSIVTRQSPMFPVRSDKFLSLSNMENSMQTLEAPAVKVFDLNNASWRDQRKASPSHVRSTPTGGSHTWRLFSPTLSLKTRDGWSSSSTANQIKMKQVSFSPPRELRDTTLSFSSHDALSDYGINPDKVQELLAVNKRGMPSLHSTSASGSSFETSATFNASPLKRQTAPLKGGLRTTTSQNKNSSLLLSGRETALHDEAYTDKSEENSVATLSLSSASKKESTQPVVVAVLKRSDLSSFDKAPSVGSNLVQKFPSSPEEEHSSQITVDADGPDYLSMLTRFYEHHNPGKVSEASSHLEKYKVCYR